MTETTGRRTFKIGAGLLILTGLVHSISLFVKQAPANDTERQLLDLMNGYTFHLPGAIRTMSELMRGFSIAFMLGILAFGVLDFAVSGERVALLKRVAWVNIIWLALMIAVSLRYFFLIPLSFLIACFVPFVIVVLTLRSETA